MNTMQLFYNRITMSPEVFDPQMQGLLRLTTASATDLAGLRNGSEWALWDSAK